MPPPRQYRHNVYLSSPHECARLLSQLYYGQPPQRGWPIVGLPLDLPCLSILAESPLSNDGVWGIAEDKGRLFPVRWRDQDKVQRISKPNIRALDLSREMMLLAIEYAEIELTRENRSLLEKDLENMKVFAKKISEEVVKSTQSFEGEKLRQTKLPDQVRSALRHNLVGKALEILTDKGTDLQKEYGQNLLDIVLIRIAFELVIGRLEDAATDLEFAPGLMEKMALHPNIRPAKQAQIQIMTIQKLIFEGNYKEAGELLGSMMGEHVGQDPPMSQKESAFHHPPGLVTWGVERTFQSFQLIPSHPTCFLGRDAMILDVLQPLVQRQQMLSRIRNTTCSYYNQRGLLSLYEGDIPSAKKRFEQSHQAAVPEWGVPEISNVKADLYLKLIKEAEKKR
jgi:hypothetical protein